MLLRAEKGKKIVTKRMAFKMFQQNFRLTTKNRGKFCTPETYIKVMTLTNKS